MKTKELAQRIFKFLNEYTQIRPDYDPTYDDKNDRFTSPDASEMDFCANLLLLEKIPESCNSSWENGGYKPYNSKTGREEHDFLKKEIYKLINS